MHYCFVHYCNMPIQSTMFPWSLTRRHGRGRTGGTRCYSGSNSKHPKCLFFKDTFKCGTKMYFCHLIGTHSKGNYFLGVWIWYLYSILKASWFFLRVTDMSISSAWFQGQRRLHRLAEPVQEQIAWHNYLKALHDLVCSSSPQWYLTINIRFVLFYEENCSEG